MSLISDFKDRLAFRIVQLAQRRVDAGMPQTDEAIERMFAIAAGPDGRMDDERLATILDMGSRMFVAGADLELVQVFQKIAASASVTSDDLLVLGSRHGYRISPRGSIEPTNDELEAFHEAWRDPELVGRPKERVRRGLRAVFALRTRP